LLPWCSWVVVQLNQSIARRIRDSGLVAIVVFKLADCNKRIDTNSSTSCFSVFLLFFCFVLSYRLSESEKQVRDLQRAKEVLLELNRFETQVAQSAMVITNPG
jgi:hypothetical protein